MRHYFRALSKRIEKAAIRAGILATEEEDEYLSWADARLDELALQTRLNKVTKRPSVIDPKQDPASTWKGHNH